MSGRDLVDGGCRFVGAVVILYTLYVFCAAIFDMKFPQRVMNDATAIGLLHLCYPEGIYKAEADPLCPDLNKIILGELNEK